jgi:hypothetical protein
MSLLATIFVVPWLQELKMFTPTFYRCIPKNKIPNAMCHAAPDRNKCERNRSHFTTIPLTHLNAEFDDKYLTERMRVTLSMLRTRYLVQKHHFL